MRAIKIKINLFDNIVCIVVGGDKKMHFDDINLDKNYTPSGAYGRSKLANILFTAELAKRLSGKSHQQSRWKYALKLLKAWSEMWHVKNSTYTFWVETCGYLMMVNINRSFCF